MNFEIFDVMIDGILVVDDRMMIVYANQSMLDLCGLPGGRIIGKKKLGEVLSLDPPAIDLNGLTSFREATSYHELSLVTSSGKRHRVRAMVQRLSETPSLWMLYAHDVTLEERLQDKYQAELAKKETLIQQLDHKLFETSLLYEIVRDLHFQPGVKEAVGLVLEKLEGAYKFSSSLALFFDNRAKKLQHFTIRHSGVAQDLGEVLAMHDWSEMANAALASEFPLFLQKGTAPELERLLASLCLAETQNMLLIPLRTKESFGLIILLNTAEEAWLQSKENLEVFGAVGTQMLLTVENFDLYQRAIRDSLTRLYNLNYFLERLAIEVKSAKRANGLVSLIMIDIDHFKNFNDTYGHRVGDQVLWEVAEVLRRTCRDTDLCARYGGEEFAVIMPGSDKSGAYSAAERIRQAINSLTLRTEHGKLKITASLGFATFPFDAENHDQLIILADKALYEAKRVGRDNTQAFEERML